MKTILVDAMNTFVLKDEGIFEEMHTLLEKYPHKKVILTNADDQQMIDFWLDNMPYEVFTLKHNPEKTDPSYYAILLTHFWRQPADVIYFEHNEDAVKSAQSAWITTMHYNKDTKDLIQLKEFLDTHLS